MDPYRCEECRKLLFELSSATSETLAIRKDIIASRRANRAISTAKVQRANDANTVRQTALEAIRAHQKENHPR